MNSRFQLWGFTIVIGLLIVSCTPRQPEVTATISATITHIDSLTVYCDEAYQYLMAQEIRIYELNQPDKHIHIVYEPETEVLKHLMIDSFAAVIVGRNLKKQDEDELFRKTRLQVEQHPFAKDGISIIANHHFAKDTIPYSLLLAILSGKNAECKVVFEGKGSGVISYMFAQISTSTSTSAFAVRNADELIDYIQKDTHTIGLMPYAAISDEDDTAVQHLLKKVKVLVITKVDSSGKTNATTACQSEIADGSYPLHRPINFITHTMDDKVGTGFANFLYKEQSGRIILKSGLVPTIMPTRVLNVNTDGIK